jgi:uncharacterized protein
MRSRLAGGAIGLVFGLVLVWSGMSNPAVIQEALLFQNGYLYLFFASAVAVAAVGLQLVRRRERRALLTGVPVTWTPERPGRRHVVGSLIFGVGWGVADACPGPILAQVGQGVPWALLTLVGALVGVYVYLRRTAVETEPATDPAGVPAPATAAGG